jgi:myosin-15
LLQDIIEEICAVLNIHNADEMEEYSLYCIVEGDTFTVPLARNEYILDVTTELHKKQHVSTWHSLMRFPCPCAFHFLISINFENC